MNFLETLFSILPLPIGNISVSLLLLCCIYAIVTLIVSCGIEALKFSLASDDKFAPKYEWNNPLLKIKSLFFTTKIINNIAHSDRGVYLKYGKIYDMNSGWGKNSQGWYTCTSLSRIKHFKNEEEARLCEKYEEIVTTPFNYLLLTLPVVLDLTFFFLSMWFIPTLCLLAVCTLVFTTRTIAKKLYKTTYDHGNRLDTYDSQIKDLQKVNTDESK